MRDVEWRLEELLKNRDRGFYDELHRIIFTTGNTWVYHVALAGPHTYWTGCLWLTESPIWSFLKQPRVCGMRASLHPFVAAGRWGDTQAARLLTGLLGQTIDHMGNALIRGCEGGHLAFVMEIEKLWRRPVAPGGGAVGCRHDHLGFTDGGGGPVNVDDFHLLIWLHALKGACAAPRNRGDIVRWILNHFDPCSGCVSRLLAEALRVGADDEKIYEFCYRERDPPVRIGQALFDRMVQKRPQDVPRCLAHCAWDVPLENVAAALTAAGHSERAEKIRSLWA